MFLPDYRFTKEYCSLIIDELVGIFFKSCLDQKISFLVYGSYFSSWRNGISDLDAIIYFQNHWPTQLKKNIKIFQWAMFELYQKLPLCGEEGFFNDFFIIDGIHGRDGRFLNLDQGFMVFNPNQSELFGDTPNHGIVFGSDFISHIQPYLISLRHPIELELAIDLQNLRNFLLFEIPKLREVTSFKEAAKAIKAFKNLPRALKILLGEPLIKKPTSIKNLRTFFGNIDLQPLEEFWQNTSNRDSLDNYLHRWYDLNDNTFMACLECYEQILLALIQNISMKSIR